MQKSAMTSIMEYEKLCRAVEVRLHREMHTPADFDYLSDQLQKKTGSSVSSTTLMRLWGYRPSVMVRMNTLDILARFIGYEDYTHFHRAKMEGAPVTGETAAEESAEQESEAEGEEMTVKKRHSRVRWGWAMAAVVVVLAVVGGLLYNNGLLTHEVVSERTETEARHFISKLSEVRSDRKYLIHTRKDRRGILGICGRHLASTYGMALFYRSEEPAPFALIKHGGSYYLYSVPEDRFVNVLLYLTDEPLRGDFGEKDWCAWELREEHDCLVFDFRGRSRVYTLNINAFDGMIVDNFGTAIGAFDDGNLFTLEDVGPFDTTEAMRCLEHTPPQRVNH